MRPVAGKTTGYSNHASGTAVDINATQHVLGKAPERSLSGKAIATIRARLRWAKFGGVVRWVGDYNGGKVVMHAEINAPLKVVNAVGLMLLRTPRGRRIAKANPGSETVVRA